MMAAGFTARARLGTTLLVALCVLSSPPPFIAAQARRGAALQPGDHTLSIEHGGRRRSYIVHVPRPTRTSLPVIVAFWETGPCVSVFGVMELTVGAAAVAAFTVTLTLPEEHTLLPFEAHTR